MQNRTLPFLHFVKKKMIAICEGSRAIENSAQIGIKEDNIRILGVHQLQT